MTKRTRRILFYAATLSFFVIAVGALFYSNGWRFDLETFTLNRLGGIYFDKIPDGATLTIDKLDMQFNPSFFGSSILIANLFPKTYTAHIERSGYQSWSKQIAVEPSLVTEIPPIIMLSTSTPAEQPVATHVADLWIKRSHLITRTSAGTLLFKGETIPGAEVMTWADDASAVVTQNVHGYYYFLSLDTPSNALTLDSAFSAARAGTKIGDHTSIRTVAFEPNSATTLILQTDAGLYLFDTGSFSVTPVSQAPIRSFAADPQELLFISNNNIFAFPWDAAVSQQLHITPSLPNPDRITAAKDGFAFTLLDTNGTLTFVDRHTLTARTITTDARTALFSPASMELVFTTANQEFGIYTYGARGQLLETSRTALLHLSGEDERTILWHAQGGYVFLQYPDSLYLLEANGQPPINLQKIDENIKKYAYDDTTNTVFLLKESGTLFSLTVQ